MNFKMRMPACNNFGNKLETRRSQVQRKPVSITETGFLAASQLFSGQV